jgi:hypothetical protein
MALTHLRRARPARAVAALVSSVTALAFPFLVLYALLGGGLTAAWREVTIIAVAAGCLRFLIRRPGIGLSVGIGVVVSIVGVLIVVVWATSRI